MVSCGQSNEPSESTAADKHIECIIGETPQNCTIEHSPARVTVRHPDGGFRRFALARDGALSAADGAEMASGTLRPDKRLEVRIGGDRYLIPAR